MSTTVDEGGGRIVGSQIRTEGRVMGLPISLQEAVVDQPHLLVITDYRMGFEVTPADTSSRVRAFVDHELPATAPQSWLGRLFGGAYARWCIARMAADASDFKGQKDAPSKPQSGSSSP